MICLANIINSLYKVMKHLTIMIPLSVLATAGALAATVFIVILIGFVFVVGLLLKLINKTLIINLKLAPFEINRGSISSLVDK